MQVNEGHMSEWVEFEGEAGHMITRGGGVRRRGRSYDYERRQD